MMRALVWIIGIAAALWSGYWFVGSSGTETVLKSWLEDRRGAGWAVNYNSLDTVGFPNRFDTTLTGIELADPKTGVAWSAPMFQLLTLSYAPNHVIAVFPDTQRLSSPYEKLDIESRDMRASLVVEPDLALTLDRMTLTAEGARITSSAGWTTAVESVLLATRQNGDAQVHDVAFNTLGLTLPDPIKRALDPTGLLPMLVTEMKLDATISFDAPWDLDAIERRRPAITALALRDMSAAWGGLQVRVAGDLTVDAQGIPEGSLDVRAVNWRDMLEVLQANGTLPADLGPIAEAALNALANASGNPNTLDAPLNLRGGFIRLGPIPLGPAPRLVIR